MFALGNTILLRFVRIRSLVEDARGGINLVEQSKEIQEHYWCREFGVFRILSGHLLKKLMNRRQNIYVVFKKRNPRATREIIYKNYIIMKAQDKWHSRRSLHITINNIKKRFTSNRV